MMTKKVISPSKECAVDKRDFNESHFNSQMEDVLFLKEEIIYSDYADLEMNMQMVIFEAYYEAMSEEFRLESIVECGGLKLMSRVLFETGVDDMNDAADVLRQDLFNYLKHCVAEQYAQFIEFMRIAMREH